MLTCGSLLGFGANEAIGKNGLDQRKDMLALGLPAHDAASRLSFTAPLPISVRVRGLEEFDDMLPGWTCPLSHELVELGPQLHQRGIDDGARGIQQPQDIGL